MEQLPTPECKGRGSCDQCVARRMGMVITRHHIWHPKDKYTSDIERRFRNHPDHIRMMPWCEHRELHLTQKPPEKPPIAHMVAFLRRSGHDTQQMETP